MERRAGLSRPHGGAGVSGRSAGQVAALFGAPAFAVSGSRERSSTTPTVVAFATRDPGLLLEDKPLGCALHLRLAPRHEAEATRLGRALADTHAFGFQPGKMMVEVRAALGTLMREPPWRPRVRSPRRSTARAGSSGAAFRAWTAPGVFRADRRRGAQARRLVHRPGGCRHHHPGVRPQHARARHPSRGRRGQRDRGGRLLFPLRAAGPRLPPDRLCPHCAPGRGEPPHPPRATRDLRVGRDLRSAHRGTNHIRYTADAKTLRLTTTLPSAEWLDALVDHVEHALASAS